MSSYTPPPTPDMTAEEYLQQLMRQGFLAAAAIAHLIREVREGYIESDIPVGAYISWPGPGGHFSVEIADGPPVPARNYRCGVRSPAERADYLHERDQQRAPGGAGWVPSRTAQDFEPSGEQQPAAAPDVKAPEVVDEETPKPAPTATAAEEPLKTRSVEITEAKRQQGTLEPDITKWLLTDMTSSTAAGKQILSADAGLYYDAGKKQFPGVHYRELRRAFDGCPRAIGPGETAHSVEAGPVQAAAQAIVDRGLDRGLAFKISLRHSGFLHFAKTASQPWTV